jgi:5-methyltetrahydrofolate--homocysteine methyltransferase
MTKEVTIGDNHPTVLIGERINPTGKNKMAEALGAGNLEIVRSEALAQVQAGANIIDVNVGAAGVNEVTLLPQAVQMVMDTVDVPLCIDSANPDALEAALKVYQGKPIINSVKGEKRSLERVLPLVKEYGAAVIGLTMDEEGILNDADKRVAIAHKIVERAGTLGIPREDIIIDCLASLLALDTSSGLVTIEAVRRVKAELGVNLILAGSAPSWGLPDRSSLNNTFLAIAIAAGVNCLFVDVAKTRPTVLASDLIMNHDKDARRYIEAYRQR